jgi:methionine-rich copper-binding protein CopC
MYKPIIIKNNVAVVSFFIINIATIVPFYSNPAYGHANPVSYSPSANAIITRQQQGFESLPNKVVILYSERPEPKVSYIHVTNSKNERVDNNDFKITGKNDREATVTLDKSKLSEGVYSVSWLVLSRDDGHITKGSYVFDIQSPQHQQPQQGVISTNRLDYGNNSIFSESSNVENVNLTLKIAPFDVGRNTFNVTLTDLSGEYPTNIRNVILSFTNHDAGIGPIVATLNKTTEGRFIAQGSYFSQPGSWDIKITGQRSGAYDLNHTFEAQVNTSTVNNTSST